MSTAVHLHCPPIVWNHPTSATVLLRSCWKSMSMSISGPVNIWVTSRDPVTNFYGPSSPMSCMSSPSQPSFSGLSMSPMHQRQCGAFVLITFSWEPLLYANHHLKPKLQWRQSVSGLWLLKILFGSQALGFLRRRCRESLECHKVPYKRSYTVFVRVTVLPRGFMGIYWRQSHQK